jgi:branched-chain amino acid transport system substrate-binding protein
VRTVNKALAVIVTAALAASACGGGGGKKGLSGTVKLVGLWEIKGESSAAIDDYQNGARLALEQITAAGGIGGKQVTLDRVPLSVSDPQKATSQFLQAVDKKPTVLLGIPSATSVLAAKSQIDRAAIPLISTSSSTSTLRFGASGGSKWLWQLETYDGYKDQAAVKYATEKLGASRIGLTGTSESYGTTNIADLTSALQARSLKPFAVSKYSPTATDVTQSVLAMKGADAVITFAFPVPLAVQIKQFAQNGLTIPLIGSSSTNIAVQYKMVSGDPLKNVYSVVSCDPTQGSQRQQAKDFGAAYQQKYGTVPTDLAADAYDAVWVAKAAIEKAGSTSPDAINKAMAQIKVTDKVVCSQGYQADGSHIMSHDVSIDKFSTAGTTQEIETYTFPAQGAAS